MVMSLYEDLPKGKRALLGKASLDLAQYADLAGATRSATLIMKKGQHKSVTLMEVDEEVPDTDVFADADDTNTKACAPGMITPASIPAAVSVTPQSTQELQDEINRLQLAVTSLSNERTELGSQLEAKKGEISKLQASIEETSKQIAVERDQAAEVGISRDKLTKILSFTKGMLEVKTQLQEKTTKWQEEKDLMKQEISDLNIKTSELLSNLHKSQALSQKALESQQIAEQKRTQAEHHRDELISRFCSAVSTPNSNEATSCEGTTPLLDVDQVAAVSTARADKEQIRLLEQKLQEILTDNLQLKLVNEKAMVQNQQLRQHCTELTACFKLSEEQLNTANQSVVEVAQCKRAMVLLQKELKTCKERHSEQLALCREHSMLLIKEVDNSKRLSEANSLLQAKVEKISSSLDACQLASQQAHRQSEERLCTLDKEKQVALHKIAELTDKNSELSNQLTEAHERNEQLETAIMHLKDQILAEKQKIQLKYEDTLKMIELLRLNLTTEVSQVMEKLQATTECIQKQIQAQVERAELEAYKSHVEKLTHELATTDFVIGTLYYITEPVFDSSGIPCVCETVLGRLKTWNGFEHPDFVFFKKIMAALVLLTKASLHNPTLSFYTLSITWNLVSLIEAELADGLAETSKEKRRDVLLKPIAQPANPTVKEELVYELKQTVLKVFDLCVKHTVHEISPLVSQAIFDEKSAVLATEAHRTKTNKSDLILGALKAILDRLRSNNIPKHLCMQFFALVCYGINVELFNSLVTKPELCTCGNGFQIRYVLSKVEEFISKFDYLSGARNLLEQIKQVANFLVLDKTVLLDAAAVTTAFGALSPSQIAHMAHSFHPDNFSPHPMPPQLLQSLPQVDPKTVQLDPNFFPPLS
ncbi:hypothetical protein Pelo_6800 [Pelomyxa schiedti]|nr:hypothetical protein Pelo_6800 [Pelomyxa schiedti]